MTSNKLIIWDFDGVISDTEKLWLENRRQLVNKKFGLNWDFATVNHYLGGMSDKTKRQVLDGIGLITDDDFWSESMAMDLAELAKGIKLTAGIENIFQNSSCRQCIATGGIMDKTIAKIHSVGIEKYFPHGTIFTADMVEHGKPEPDLFLLAAESMGAEPSDCIVIEDSLAGMTAALKAGMNVIAFLGCEMNQGAQYLKKVKDLGINNLFFTMDEVRTYLIDFCSKKD